MCVYICVASVSKVHMKIYHSCGVQCYIWTSVLITAGHCTTFTLYSIHLWNTCRKLLTKQSLTMWWFPQACSGGSCGALHQYYCHLHWHSWGSWQEDTTACDWREVQWCHHAVLAGRTGHCACYTRVLQNNESVSFQCSVHILGLIKTYSGLYSNILLCLVIPYFKHTITYHREVLRSYPFIVVLYLETGYWAESLDYNQYVHFSKHDANINANKTYQKKMINEKIWDKNK